MAKFLLDFSLDDDYYQGAGQKTKRTKRELRPMQIIFDSLAYGFEWVKEADGGWWYKFDRKTAERSALQARNAEARRLTKEGWQVSKFSLRNQLRFKGGIGSGYPHIEVVSNGYGLNYSLPC